ncbi:MAG TPA: MtrB/PioB family decaheme-associated outer membrane protein, partial [Burkholderiales bacterium]|nr:MtrB/PioB family decaheme-associated outer membrane protein [Burkholderiales bacterium]
MTSPRRILIGNGLFAVGVLAAFGLARAQDIGELTAPGSSVTVGVGVASGDEKDRARFGMFNGLRKHDVNGLFGFSYLDRDSESGRWFSIEGRNLGLDNRELGLSYRRLGDMKLWADYSEVVRHDPRTINTGLIGAGTTTPTVVLLPGPGTGHELNLELKRKSISLNAEKWLMGPFQLEVNFKNEDKDGARFFGKGFACTSGAAPGCAGPTATATGWALLMLPEPVNSTIRQLDAKLNYNGQKLKLSGGYYGSWYTNANGTLTPSVPGVLANGLGTPLPLSAGLQGILNLPMALWPDNQAHQVFLAGNYAITPTTRVNFKYSYTHATQNEDFLSMGLTGAPAGRANLGGEINTTRAQVGLSAHPIRNVHVHGDLKYEEKKNNTPIAVYNIEGVNTFTNGNPSPKKWDGKLEATYRLPAGYAATGGVFYESEDFGTFTPTDNVAGISGMRQKMEELGYRLELRKSMSETLTGWLSYTSSKRDGNSSWLKPRSLPGTGLFEASDTCPSVGANACIFNRTAIFPFMFMDRERDKWKAMANWEPIDRLSLTFFVEDGRDRFSGPTEHGLRDTGMRMYSADAGYALSKEWRMSAYWSY